jgi:cation diffusion facilitator family transporter
MALERWGWASIGVNVLLTLINLTIAAASGSLAVAAEMVHNLVDLAASVAVLAGLNISQRQSKAFPYGLYKVENVVAVGVALLIFVSGYEIAKEALLSSSQEATVEVWMLVGVALSAVIPLIFSRYELQAGQAANSPALIADAKEYRAHIFSSGVVLAALVGQRLGWPLDRVAALIIVVLIAKMGWELLTDGMRVLLDASLDVETLNQVRAIIEQQPAVVEVHALTGRNAGRYRFIEAEIGVRVRELEKAHLVGNTIAAAIREQVPYVERALIHVEPIERPVRRLAVPLADAKGIVSEHFGTAPYFALRDVRVEDGALLEQRLVANPYSEAPRGRGLKVAEWLLEQNVDVLVTADDIQGKGPGYALGDAGVEVVITDAEELDEALAPLPRTGELLNPEEDDVPSNRVLGRQKS